MPKDKNGNVMVGIAVAAVVATTAIVGLSQLAARYARDQAKQREMSRAQGKNELVLEYVRSKFMPRADARQVNRAEWSISNLNGKPIVSPNAGYCYQYEAGTQSCSSPADPLKAPIRDVYRTWQVINGQNLCALVTPYPEFSGQVNSAVVCEYDSFDKDGSFLASLQTRSSIASQEKQKAYVLLTDIEKLSSSEQETYLSGGLSSSALITYRNRMLLPARVSFESYRENAATQADEIQVSLEDGSIGSITIPNLPVSCSVAVVRSSTSPNSCQVTVNASGGMVQGPPQVVPAATGNTSWDGKTPWVGTASCPQTQDIDFTASVTEAMRGSSVSCGRAPLQCTTVFGYDPGSVQCSISTTDKTSVWAGVNAYVARQNALRNKSARWISPLPRVGNMCPSVPLTEVQIYVSHFKTPALLSNSTLPQYKIEGIIDNIGKVFVWKNGDPSNPASFEWTGGERFCFSDPSGADCPNLGMKTLEPNTTYTLVVTAREINNTSNRNATGMVLSILNSANAVVKETKLDNTWCIFRERNTTNVLDFVPKAAGCRFCYDGVTR
jgi:hypothetical protein